MNVEDVHFILGPRTSHLSENEVSSSVEMLGICFKALDFLIKFSMIKLLIRLSLERCRTTHGTLILPLTAKTNSPILPKCIVECGLRKQSAKSRKSENIMNKRKSSGRQERRKEQLDKRL